MRLVELMEKVERLEREVAELRIAMERRAQVHAAIEATRSAQAAQAQDLGVLFGGADVGGESVITISQKITSWAVGGDQEGVAPQLEEMHEGISRPESIPGLTYKISTPLSEHALYVTINDIILNAGTDHESRRPFEIFINSKNMDHFQWIVALTRIISAVFRKGGDIVFLVEELRSVFDPSGGYFKRGGKYMPSLVAEIGEVINSHLVMIGMVKVEELDQHRQALVDSKREEAGMVAGGEYPDHATLCAKCLTRAVVMMDGCMTCLNCGDSKCS
jgi:hypothetical protein